MNSMESIQKTRKPKGHGLSLVGLFKDEVLIMSNQNKSVFSSHFVSTLFQTYVMFSGLICADFSVNTTGTVRLSLSL